MAVPRNIITDADPNTFTSGIGDKRGNTSTRAAGFGLTDRFRPDGGDDSRNIRPPLLEQVDEKISRRKQLGLLRPNLKQVRPAFGLDPIAQSFTITNDMTQNSGGVGLYATAIEVYFYSKSEKYGITLEIREMVNGVPSQTVVPLSRVSLRAKDITVSNDASMACLFEFQCPVYLQADKQYAFILKPDNNTDGYRVFSAKLGEIDLGYSGSTINKDWGQGVLFLGTNDSIWSPVLDEDLKFVIWTADFPSLSGDAILTNDDHEFLKIKGVNVSGDDRLKQPITNDDELVQPERSFICGEKVFVLNRPNSDNSARENVSHSGTITTIVPDSCAIIVDDTDASSFKDHAPPGTWLAIGNDESGYDVVQVANTTHPTASNTELQNIAMLEGQPTIQGNNLPYIVTPVADVYYCDTTTTELHLNDSNANNNTFSFKTNDIIIGENSGTIAIIKDVENKPISYFEPLIYRFVPENTEARLYMKTTTENGEKDKTWIEYNFANRGYFSDKEKFIFSRSNEVLSESEQGLDGKKSVEVKIEMDTDYHELSPIIDLQNSSILRYENLINNNSDLETGPDGNAIAKQIQKPVTLAKGLEAEDLKVYLTAYIPQNTNIEVYTRFHSSTDPESFLEKDWTKMDGSENEGLNSSKLDLYDFKELEFNIPTTPESKTLQGVININTGTKVVTGTETEFTKTIIRYTNPNDTDPAFSGTVIGVHSGARGTVIGNPTFIPADGALPAHGELTINNRTGVFEIGEKLIISGNTPDDNSAVIYNIDADFLPGDLFKIINTNENDGYTLTRISNITNDNTIVLSENIEGSAGITNAQYQKILTPHSAYKNPANDFVVQYHDKNFTVHDQYKSYQLKIVLLAEDTHIVPRIADLRAISLSV